MWRHIAANALTVMIVGLVAVAGVAGWMQAQYTGEGPLTAPICLDVPQNERMRPLAERLVSEGAITNATVFRLGADYSGRAGLLKAGSFLVREGASMAEIVEIVTSSGRSTCGTEVVFRIGVTDQDVLVRELDPETERFETIAQFNPAIDEVPEVFGEVRGKSATRYRVTMAEGATVWQVVEALRLAEFLTGEVAELPAEGTLAPDSYEVSDGMSRAALVSEMAERQSRRLAESWENRAEGLPIDSLEEALILASIIEKETSIPEERGRVASVFVNRLDRGMRLQTDPTVIYGVTEGRGTLGRGLRQSELRQATPWNTYVIEGLPPTPIANPGLASIEAALNPDDTDLIFFVADGTGGHAFSRTLEEHNANVARWRAIEEERESGQ